LEEETKLKITGKEDANNLLEKEGRLLNNQDEMSPVSSQAYLTTLCTKEVDLRT
jgi:hypothetical protein